MTLDSVPEKVVRIRLVVVGLEYGSVIRVALLEIVDRIRLLVVGCE